MEARPTLRFQLWPFFGQGAVPIVLQAETAECGHACLAMVASYFGHSIDIATLRRRWPPSLRGVMLGHLMAIARELKLSTRALRLEPSDLARVKCPAILHLDMSHFVVLERMASGSAWIVDPAVGRCKLTLREISKRFTGIALELLPDSGFERKAESARLPLSYFFTGIQGLGATLVRVLALSISLQAFVLVIPLFGQIIIDDIVVSDDRNLLAVLGVAFLLIVVIQACTSGVRAWLVTALSATLQFGWGARVFHHLIRLPLTWFERRHIGDVVSRFRSIHAIETLVASSVVEAVVDGVMALATGVVMWVYSPRLTAIVVGAVIAYALSRFAIYGPLRRATLAALVLGAKAESTFLESARAILPLKSYGGEGVREAAWQNRRADALNAEVRSHRLEVAQGLANTLIFGAEAITVLWIGALAILDGRLSVGMLVAFIAYKGQFTVRSAALIDKIIEFRLVDLHLERLADIVTAERDPGAEPAPMASHLLSGAMDLRAVWFRYSATEPYVISGLNLEISAGECVAISGPSGLGKTTLIKLMMGLLEPASGQVIVDGRDLHSGLLSSYRRQIASVMQDDQLLSGTLADNISFFDPEVDQDWLEACARLAAIHEDIVQMPMGYLTLVGDMGNTLSGGQRQRICLARALYAKPRILFLDEATSHLDPFTERRIHQAMRELKMTRVLVAHRQETLAIADRVVQLSVSAAANGTQPHAAT